MSPNEGGFDRKRIYRDAGFDIALIGIGLTTFVFVPEQNWSTGSPFFGLVVIGTMKLLGTAANMVLGRYGF